jgi:hypothetical protein
MLKRTSFNSEFRAGHRHILSLLSIMNNGKLESDDRKQTCAFTTQACQILNELRKNNLLCDARILTKNDSIEFPIHRFVLASK